MGSRYYCDYCEKVFIDDVDSRRKHLTSAHHIKRRRMHYDSFRDPRVILQEEASKIPCRRFMSTGFCQFESTCKYTHYLPEQLWEIKQQVLLCEREKQGKMNETVEIPSVDSWLIKYGQQKNSVENDHIATFWSYPESLEARTDLPTSLKKFEPKDFKDENFTEWGS